MSRRAAVTVALIAVAAAGITPAVAAPAKHHKPKPLKGSWSFTDATPDPSATAEGNVPGGGGDPYCHGGHVPAAPTDKNSYTLKVAGPGTLTVIGSNTLDWAMEVDDSKGVMIAGSDGGFPQDQEGLLVPLTKAGSYTVTYCNLTGGPTASATYSYKFR